MSGPDHLHATGGFAGAFAGLIGVGAAGGGDTHAAALKGFGLAEQAQVGVVRTTQAWSLWPARP